ncbi:MAG: YhgN family NAAT transporter [Lysobacteraceae bacterium]
MSIVSAAILLFLILDPLGNVPLFLSLLKELPPARRRIVLIREMLIAFGVLLLFLFLGQYILALMHLRQESVSIAGGIILFLIGIKMIFPQKEGIFGDVPEGEPFIVPMAVPAVAGPSGMAAVMLMANSDPGRMAEWTLALFLAWFATAVILFFSTYLYKLLGIRVLVAVERLMGMLLVALSVQMFLDGIAAYLGPATGAG